MYRIIEYPFSPYCVFTMWFPKSEPLSLGGNIPKLIEIPRLPWEILQVDVCNDLDGIIVSLTVREEDSTFALEEMPLFSVSLREVILGPNKLANLRDDASVSGRIPIVIAAGAERIKRLVSQDGDWGHRGIECEQEEIRSVTNKGISMRRGASPHLSLLIQCPPATRAGYPTIDFIYSHIAHRTGILARRTEAEATPKVGVHTGYTRSIISIAEWRDQRNAASFYDELQGFIEVNSEKLNVGRYPRAFQLATLMLEKRREDIIQESQMQIRELCRGLEINAYEHQLEF